MNQGFPLLEYLDVCARKAREHPLSVEAGASTAKSRDCARVIEYLKQHDATCYEISQALNMPYTTASARISDLLYVLKLVEDSGDRRLTGTGCKARVIRLKETT